MSHAGVAVPTYAFPLRFDPVTADFVVVEQDGIEDVSASLEVLLRTITGSRIEVPAYGGGDWVHAMEIDLNEIMAQIAEWEPRAIVDLDLTYDSLDSLVRQLRIELTEA